MLHQEEENSVEQQLEESISILSYNVNFAGCGRQTGTYSKRRGGKRVEQAIEEAIHPHPHSHLNHQGCDLICLQETHTGWEKALNTSLIISTNFPHQYWDHSNVEQCKPSGAAVLARSYLDIKVSVLESGVEGSVFPALHVLVKDRRNGHSFQVLSVHLRPPLGFDDNQKANIELSALWKTRSIRLKEMQSYWEQALRLSSLPLLIVGDFNESFESGSWLSPSYADFLMEKKVGFLEFELSFSFE